MTERARVYTARDAQGSECGGRSRCGERPTARPARERSRARAELTGQVDTPEPRDGPRLYAVERVASCSKLTQWLSLVGERPELSFARDSAVARRAAGQAQCRV